MDATALRERAEREMALAAKLLEADPSLGIAAMIMAGDQLSTEFAEERLARGDPFENVVHLVGSYARLGWALSVADRGDIPRDALYPLLPDLWRGSDPDDTDPRFLALWRDAWLFNARQTITDGRPLPKGRPRDPTIRVYRGQDRGARLGIASTLDREVAARFARGQALRQGGRDGEVVVGSVERGAVMGYLTGRGESEVIADPASVDVIRTEAP